MADTYIRGSGGVQVNVRKVAAVLVAIALLVLVAVIVELTVSATRQSDQVSRLKNHGVPVELTVTRCLGISSGVGMGIEFWQCSGTYSLAGQSYDETIAGSRTHLQTGQTLEVIADPGRPNVVWLPSSLARQDPSGTAYIAPAVLTLILVAALIAVWLVRKRLGVGLSQSDRHVDEELVGDGGHLVQHGQELSLPDH